VQRGPVTLSQIVHLFSCRNNDDDDNNNNNNNTKKEKIKKIRQMNERMKILPFCALKKKFCTWNNSNIVFEFLSFWLSK